MLGLLKKLFGSKPVEQTAEVPYKVEAPKVETPVVEKTTKPAPKAPVKQSQKKPIANKKSPRKPRSKA